MSRTPDSAVADLVEIALGRRPLATAPLDGGCIAEVHRLDMPVGTRLVAKVDRAGFRERAASEPTLLTEAAMLRALRRLSSLPVPSVVFASASLLVMEHVEHDHAPPKHADQHVAELLAQLHSVSADAFGFEHDTAIGPFSQHNPWTRSWPRFFAEQRLLPMAAEARDEHTIPQETFDRLRELARRAEEFLGHSPRPALIHGDVWSGNVLVRGSRVAAFIDPSISFADAEVELAFISLFSCFGENFWRVYHKHRPMDPGFARRRVLYNVYPLLVHARLFGGSYAMQVNASLDALGISC